MAVHTSHGAVWLKVGEGDSQEMLPLMLLLVAPHACQQWPRVQSTTDSPDILAHRKQTAAVSLWVQTVKVAPLDKGRLAVYCTAGKETGDCSQAELKDQGIGGMPNEMMHAKR